MTTPAPSVAWFRNDPRLADSPTPPFFRLFDPVPQGEKLGPIGHYARRWVPELARLPNACIHQPWRAGGRLLSEAGARLGEIYPAPIVDHAEARRRAPAAYETSK
jgi:deoxyribodipyrimidine photo-lyase